MDTSTTQAAAIARGLFDRAEARLIVSDQKAEARRLYDEGMPLRSISRAKAAKQAALNAHAEAERLGKIYDPMIEAVTYLRRRGYCVVKERGAIVVDGRPRSDAALREIVAREKRLAAGAGGATWPT